MDLAVRGREVSAESVTGRQAEVHLAVGGFDRDLAETTRHLADPEAAEAQFVHDARFAQPIDPYLRIARGQCASADGFDAVGAVELRLARELPHGAEGDT